MNVRPRASTAAHRMRALQYVFMTAGLLALGYCAAAWTGAEFYQAKMASQFANELRSTGAQTLSTRPPTVVPCDGGLVGELQIPRLGVSVMIVEGVEDGDLNRAVGHIPGTALPWRTGNVGIAGHRDTFFRPLRFIRLNDRVTLSTLQGAYRYRVVSTKVVTPGDVRALDPTGRDILTLVTCFPFYYVGSAPRRFIVRAERG